jgi:arylsulfatase A-like enzyme
LTPRPPNILLISFDDAVAPWPYRRAFGQDLRLPNFDRICAVSAAFQTAYAQAPVCGPSRASFMSGQTPQQLGVYDNSVDVFDVLPAQAMWSVRLKEAGWYCSSGGKLHHHYKPLRRNHHKVIYSDGQKRFDDDMSVKSSTEAVKLGGHRGGWATTNPAHDALYYDHQVASSTIDFLQGYDGAAPFYREVGFYSPHGPHFTPLRFKDLYDPSAFRQPDSWQEGWPEDSHIRRTQPPDGKMEKGGLRYWQDCIRNYFSAYSHGDHHLGRVWDALKASRHAGNTVVILMSDHGFHLGDRGRFSKFTLFDPVTRVPLVIHDPTRPAAQVILDPVALLDIGPTVLDLAGLPRPETWAGRSLWPGLDGAGDPDRAVLSIWHGNQAVRKGDYTLIRYEDGSTQLFDTAHDPWQQRELGSGHPAHAAMLQALEETARRYARGGEAEFS